MYKILLTSILVFLFVSANGQVKTIPKDFKTPESIDNHKEIRGLDENNNKMFNNVTHPLALTGGLLTLGGAGMYVAGAERKDIPNYNPQSTLQFIGIGTFAAGAILFAIFATERDENVPKRKKKKSYDATDWEVTR